jgi:2-iminobutanoate/2-iminopropanoate deaminase
MPRQSIEIESFAHQNPIPAATRIGPLLVSGVIPGFDPGERTMPDSVEDQVTNIFVHIGQMLDKAGAGWEHVAKIMWFVNDPDARAKINPTWLEHFPDPASRPSRHTLVIEDGGPPRVTCDFIAYIE